MKVKEFLNSAGCARLDAELILLGVLERCGNDMSWTKDDGFWRNDGVGLVQSGRIDRSWLTLHENDVLSERVIEAAGRLCQRRRTGVPLAYILGQKEFYGRSFMVTPDTLIPRPETEVAIDKILNLCYNGEIESILDVGTGSGCIAITLALELANESLNETNSRLDGEGVLKRRGLTVSPKVMALDKSAAALAVARQNAERFGAEVEFTRSDLLRDYDAVLPDVVMANLPYVDASWSWLSPELVYEPAEALYAEDGGLALIKKLVRELAERVKAERSESGEDVVRSMDETGGRARCLHLLLEADVCQHDEIGAYAEKYGFRWGGTEGYILQFEV